METYKMTYKEGYGRSWTAWDAFIEHKWPRPSDVKYQNWCPFLSPKGRWMAFYGKSYTDIRIIDLETKEIVVRDFYSHYVGYNDNRTPKEGHVYDGSHTNYSTYVPHYVYSHSYIKKFETEDSIMCMVNPDYDFNDFDPEKIEDYFKIREDIASKYIEKEYQLRGAHLAFNAFTYWAADFEFYVDIIDLSKVDDGIIKKFEGTSFIIPRSAANVRNYVNFQPFTSTDIMKENVENFNLLANFNIMEETKCHRLYENKNESSNTLLDANEQETPYKHTERLPWEDVKLKLEKYEAEKKAKQEEQNDRPK